MSDVKPHLYINSKGFYVTRHSYSGSDSFNYCARKYYLERVQGWAERTERSSKFFGIALEAAITYYHRHRMDIEAAVKEFHRLWKEHEGKEYIYSKLDLDWDRLNLTGDELLRLYAIRYPDMPFIVKDPARDFQVQTNFEVFPGTKLHGIEFTSFIDLVGSMKGSLDPVIIDMKTSGKDVPEFTVLDPQLRSYSWVKDWPNVGFLWFRKCGRAISKGDTVALIFPSVNAPADFKLGDEAIVLGSDDFGLYLTTNEAVVDGLAQFVGEKKEVKAARQAYIESNGFHVQEKFITKQRVQYKQVLISKESAEDIGRSIKRDIVNIASATEKDFFPMQSGVRFPNEKCPMCPMRGICANKPDLRDSLLTRKQLDELDFGKESE